jgi:phosphatidylserine decarboxylase
VTIDRAATPFVVLSALPALAAALLLPLWAAAALVLLPLGVALFFRDPERHAPADRRLVVAPADGRVMHAGPARAGEAPPGDWLQVTIFLSLFDVHINRTPVTGQVTKIRYVPGSYLAAFKPNSFRNEHSEIWIDHRGTSIVARQVVGLLARRVVTRVVPGDVLGPGARIGLMKFGSRMDVFLPTSAELLVKAGDRVRGGESPIGRLPPES